uniref:Uncharacterized protein n=1 Tax=Sphenodon punctatus TaxID=8508 RepID=A0A8D0HHK7_SPHPU
MAGALLPPAESVSLERIVQVARERGYTAQGEMFSAPATTRTPTTSPAARAATRPTGPW